MGFPILTIILVLLILLAFRYRNLSKKTDDSREAFWQRESEANMTVRRDIDMDALPYIKVPLSKFPSDLTDDDKYMEIIGKIRALSDTRMLNLNGKTNTDIKLEYGRNHLEEMQKVGENFSELTVLIANLGEYLFSIHRYDDAVTVLEFGISIGTDISKNFTVLGDCYANTGKLNKVPDLIEKVQGSKMVMESAILKHLNTLLPGAEQASENFVTEDNAEG